MSTLRLPPTLTSSEELVGGFGVFVKSRVIVGPDEPIEAEHGTEPSVVVATVRFMPELACSCLDWFGWLCSPS